MSVCGGGDRGIGDGKGIRGERRGKKNIKLKALT